jgi:F-type H+-transporting ATPase subunit b
MLSGSLIKRCLLSTVFLIFISVLICAPAISEETANPDSEATTAHVATSESGEGGAHESDRSADLLDLLYRFINFTLLVIILVVVFRKARLTDYLSVRSEEIRNRLEDLKSEKEAAEKKYLESEGRVRDFESKRRDLLEEYRKEGLAERDRIIEGARERVKQIIAQSEISIEQEFRSARNRLKQDVAEMAIGQAGEIIRKEINEQDHDQLVNEFIERVRKIN